MKALTPVKAIRKKCLECAGQRYLYIRYCEHAECPLFAFRMGRNPKRKGIGGKVRESLKLPTQVMSFSEKGLFK